VFNDHKRGICLTSQSRGTAKPAAYPPLISDVINMRLFALIINVIVILWIVGAGLYAHLFLRLYSDFKGTILIFIILGYALINFFTILRLKPPKDENLNEIDDKI
jgi:hypothetical protein